MIRRNDIRYHARWVRVLCCLAIATGLTNAVHFGLLALPEFAIRDFLVYSEWTLFRYASEGVEVAVLIVVCLLLALPRIEHPALMVAYGGGLAVVYVAVFMTALLGGNYLLPAISPLLAIPVATGLLQTMAWSEERFRRRRMEGIEEARQQFTDMLVHDLKRRISSIVTSLTVLDQEADTHGERAGEVRATMRAAADRMLMLVNDLLEIRKIEEGEMALAREPVRLAALVREAVHEQRSACDLTAVRCEITAADDLQIQLDRRIFSRVISNLLWNAIQHAPADSAIEIACLGGDGRAVLQVANRGTPIPAEDQESVFRAFVSTHSDPDSVPTDSTGLGLSFCRLAVEAHGGTIQLESPWRPHADGVKVEVRLPRS